MFWTVVFAIFVVYYMTQTERYMCQYVCLIHFLGQTDKTSSMPMFVLRKHKCVWYPSNQSLKNSQCVGPQKCIPISNEICLRWFGHNSRLVIGISWDFFTLGISRIEKLFISWDVLLHTARFCMLNFSTFSVRGCWAQPMSLFWKLVDETQISKPP